MLIKQSVSGQRLFSPQAEASYGVAASRPLIATLRLLLGLTAATVGCSGDDLVLPREGQPAKVVVVGGDGQSGPSGAALAEDVSVLVTDGLNRPIAEQPVVFTFSAGTSAGRLSPDTVLTDANGHASTTWILGPAAGPQSIHAVVLVGGVPSPTLAVDFSATATSGGAAQVRVVTGDGQTGSVASALPESLVVKVVDAFGNPVAGITVQWTIVSGGGLVDPVTVVTGADGRAATQRVLGSSAGTQRAQAAVDGLSGSPIPFRHTAVPATPAQLVYISGSDVQAPAGSPLAAPLVVRLVDANNNGIGGRSVSWVVDARSGSVSPVNTMTDADGYASTQWTLSSTIGGNLVNAVFSGLPSVLFTATGTADVPKTIVLNGGDHQSGTVGSTLSTALSVKITDARNVPVEGVAVTWTAQGGGTVDGAATATTATDANGVARANRMLGALPGTYTTTAVRTGLTGSPVTFTSTATIGAAAQLAIVTQPSAAASSGAALAVQPVIQLQDAKKNAVAQAGVAITVSVSGGVRLDGTRVVQTDASGRATFTGLAISAVAGTYALTFTSGSLTPITSGNIQVTPGVAAKLAIVRPPSANALSGQAFAQQPIVEVQDAAGNAIGGAGRVITAELASGAGTLGGTLSATTTASNRATFTNLQITGAAGARTLRFKSNGLANIESSAIALGAGSASGIAVQGGDNQTATAGTVLATDPSVIVRDAGGNPVQGVQVTFAVASGGGRVTGATQTTNSAGIATVGSWQLGSAAGTNTLTATAPGLGGSPVTFTATGTAGAAAKLAIVTQPSASVTSGQVFPQQPVIEVQDAAGNAVTTAGRTVTVAITTGGGTLNGTLSVATGASGQATFTDLAISGATGPRTLRFASSGLTAVNSSPVALGAGAATQITVQGGNNQTAPAGAVLQADPSVIVRDAAGNPVQGVQVVFAVASGGGSATGATQTTNALGIAAVGSWQLGPGAGTNTLTATAPGLNGSPVTFTATATAFSTTTSVSSNDNPSNVGDLVTFTATVSSAGGTPTGSVRWTVDGGEAATTVLSGGQTTYTTSALPAGSHSARAEYLGSGTFTSSLSPSLSQSVAKVSTTTTITSDNPDPSSVGQSVVVAFSVTSGTGTPTGTVTVTASGGIESCSASVAAGSCNLTLLLPGNRTLTATYSGGDAHAASSGTESHQVVILNAPPQANDDSYNLTEGGSLSVNDANGVLHNDTDPENASLTAMLVSGPTQATGFVLNPDGSFTYNPPADFVGTDSFTYRASDGSAQSSLATVTITVEAPAP